MTLSDCRAGRLRGIVGFGLCLAAYAVHWCAAPAGAAEKPPLVVNVTPGHTKAANVGCGFGDLSDDVYELNITLTPDNIVNAGIDDQTGALWDWYRDEMGEVTDIKKFRAAGVDPNKRFWVVIWAKLRTEGEPGGDPTYWMSISDLDADADTDNDSIANPRTPSESDDEDFAEYPGYQAPPVIRGIVLGVNDDHDEFLPAVHPWGRDAANTTADLTKEGANYNNQSVGLAQIKVKVGVKRAPGDLNFSVPSTIRLFEGELPEAGNKGAAFLGNRRIDSVGEKTYLFYMEGVSPDNDYGFVRFAYDPDGAGTGEAVDTLAFLPVRMDIDVDSDNSGTVDGSDAEDLREAAPGELGMIVPAVDNPGGFGFGKPGVLRGLYSQAVAYMLNDPQRPAVITLKKVSGAGDVRIWKVRQGQEPVLMLDTSAGGGSTTTDGDGHSLFELLGDASDHNILITGKTPGEVLLGLQLTVNGAKVAMDVVRTTIVRTENTQWLVTHDPTFEKKHAQRVPEKYKQAELMDNKAWASITCSAEAAPTLRAELWDLGGPNEKICEGHYVCYFAGKAIFEFRTTVGSSTGGAKTDSNGNIYVEGTMLPEGLEGTFTDYYICFYDGSTKIGENDIKIGPIFSDLSFGPNILADPPAVLDPYEDQFDISTGWGGVWYGMQIQYDLDDDVVGEFIHPVTSSSTMFGFETDSSAPPADRGDMTGTHYLSTPSSLMQKATLNHTIKWEGFNELLSSYVEEANAIFMQADQNGHEAELERPWGPQDGRQSHKGAAPQHVVGEGKYRMKIGCKREADKSQVQRLQIGLDVQFR